jgi:hypothetical protein
MNESSLAHEDTLDSMSPADRELEEMDFFDLEERLVLTRDFMDVVVGRSAPTETSEPRPDGIRLKRLTTPTPGLRHFLLPGSNGTSAGGHPDSAREAYDDHVRLYETDRRTLIPVIPGRMWTAQNTLRPIFHTPPFSEHSIVIGFGNTTTMAAHIGHSETDQTVAVVDYMQTQGITPGNIYVVASFLPEGQAGDVARSHARSRINTVKGYTVLGIPENNVLSFTADGDTDSLATNEWITHDLAHVTVTSDGLLKNTVDMHARGMNEWVEGGYRDDQVITSPVHDLRQS